LVVVSAVAEAEEPSLVVGVKESDGTYSLAGEEAPIHFLVESFLLDAASFHSLGDPDAYQGFCELFGIDASWPSAGQLGTLIEEIFAEYNARRRDAHDVASLEAVGQVWKPRALGEGFGSLFGSLRVDGLRLSLDVFLRTIEMQERPRATRFSTEPFMRADLEAGARAFWAGAASSNDEVARRVDGGKS
jgi:hypothetical protein